MIIPIEHIFVIMSQEDILQSTKTVIQGLDALKNEHGKMLGNILETMQTSTTDQNKMEEKAGLLRKSMDMIELGKEILCELILKIHFFSQGIGEAQVMIQLGNHLQNLEAEKHKLRTQVKRLCQENAWLRDELASSQKKLHDSEQTNATYSVELEHLKFLKEVKQYDVNDPNSTSNNVPSSGNAVSGQATDIVNDLFPNDDENYLDQHDTTGGNQSRRYDSYADLAQSAGGSFISSTGYEIPARLKTLHNLVIQYASQGRYEVAVPLCRQALEDLEKTSGHQRKI